MMISHPSVHINVFFSCRYAASEMEIRMSHGTLGRGERPRTVGTMQAATILDGDWGTSIAYILAIGLALFGPKAPWFLLIIGVIMLVVALGYEVVCKMNPDGGGVYRSLRKLGGTTGKTLSVIGALKLLADYFVTITLSGTDAFHYGGGETWFVHMLPTAFSYAAPYLWLATICAFLYLINYFGPHIAAAVAAPVSLAAFILGIGLALFAIPLLPEAWANTPRLELGWIDILKGITGILLALSGVEAISNATGVMRDPTNTSRRAIQIVLFKVLLMTVVLGVALNALPDEYRFEGEYVDGNFTPHTRQVEVYDLPCAISKVIGDEECHTAIQYVAREDMLVAFGEYLFPYNVGGMEIGLLYGQLLGIVFTLLLISACNTAAMDIAQVMFNMAHDGELPHAFTKLNRHGVPIIALVVACSVPVVIQILAGASITGLAALYAIGVAGAVTLNLLSTAMRAENTGDKIITGAGGTIMAILFVALAYFKMEATIFVAIVLSVGMAARTLSQQSRTRLDFLVFDPSKDSVEGIQIINDESALSPLARATVRRNGTGLQLSIILTSNTDESALARKSLWFKTYVQGVSGDRMLFLNSKYDPAVDANHIRAVGRFEGNGRFPVIELYSSQDSYMAIATYTTWLERRLGLPSHINEEGTDTRYRLEECLSHVHAGRHPVVHELPAMSGGD